MYRKYAPGTDLITAHSSPLGSNTHALACITNHTAFTHADYTHNLIEDFIENRDLIENKTT